MKHSCFTKRLQLWIEEGRGQGHGLDFMPWLQITRRGMPKNSTLILAPLPGLGRHGHFLSRNEWELAVFLIWLGVADLREQYPLWPWSHPHPLYDHPDCQGLVTKSSRGTLAIASDLGIRHPLYPGKGMAYIMTTDLLVTVRSSWRTSLCAFAVKSADDLQNDKLAERAAEKLHIEKQWAAELNIPWRVLSNHEIPETLRHNLKSLVSCADIPSEFPQDACERFAEYLKDNLSADHVLGEILHAAQQKSGLTDTQVSSVFRHMLWHRQLPIDIRSPWVMNVPPRMTNFDWVKASQRHLLGSDDE